MHLNCMCITHSKPCKYIWETDLKKKMHLTTSFFLLSLFGLLSEKEKVARKNYNMQDIVYFWAIITCLGRCCKA